MTIARKQGIFFAAIILMGIFMLAPQPTQAVGLAGDIFCGTKYCYPGNCVPSPKNPKCVPCQTIKCPDNTNGYTTPAQCVSSAPGKCQAIGAAGGDKFGLDLVKQMLGSLMQKLMQGSQGGGSGSGSGSPATTPSGPTGCGSYVATPDVAQVSTSNTGGTCYYYQAPVSSLLNSTNSTGDNTSSVSEQLNALTNTNNNTDTNTNTNTTSEMLNQLTAQVKPAVVSTTTATDTRPIVVPQGSVGGLTSGVSGDIRLLGNSGTILAGSVDQSGNSVTAGFFGSDTFTGQPTGVIANLCQSRPWASNILSYVLPPTFFDSLCVLRGYQVGKPQPVIPKVTIIQSTPKATPKAVPATSTMPTVTPKVSIWAVPATVPLGSRTSIFCNSQGVTNCAVSSPDGSFSQNSLSGGASTVALTGATTFTMSCIAPDGSHVTDYVTVNLSI